MFNSSNYKNRLEVAQVVQRLASEGRQDSVIDLIVADVVNSVWDEVQVIRRWLLPSVFDNDSV